jgi:hypothetical protein
MKNRLHLACALLAFFLILSFFTSTIISEAFGNDTIVATIKRMIVYGLWILVPALAITGVTGWLLAKSRAGKLVSIKKRRMPFIAANGIIVLVPAAIYLDHLAAAGEFDTTFYLVQGIELLVGGANLVLMSLNIIDGLQLTGRLRPEPVKQPGRNGIPS